MNVYGLGQCSLDNIFLVDSFPVDDTKKEVIAWTTAGGGPVATALVSLCRLDVRCRFFGVIGDDEAGGKIMHSLTSEAIDTTGLVSRSSSTSQVAFICVEKKSGKRTIYWKRPSCDPLTPHELNDDFLANADFLLLDGLMAEASLYAARKAREQHVPVMLDAGRVREGMIELAHLCDYVVVSEEFARELVHKDNPFGPDDKPFQPEKALLLMKSFHAIATTITLGAGGSITMCGDDIFRTPPFKVDVVDTTGAGDVFHGGYIYGLLQQWDIQRVLRFASAFAALKCRNIGGRAGIPGLDDVEKLLADQPDTKETE